MKQGFVKVAAAVPTVKVADCKFNEQQIEALIAQAEEKHVEIIVFPELSITAYTCQDLFRQTALLRDAENQIVRLMDFSRQMDIISIVGLPVVVGNLLLNCAAIIQQGHLLGLIPKTYLPNYSEFYEKRWFASSQDLHPTEIVFAGTKLTVSAEPQLFRTTDGVLFGIEICEDVWAPTPPSNTLALAGADIIFNLSTSNDLLSKHNYLVSLIAQQSARTISGYVYSGSGYGESTQDLVFGSNALIYENGTLLSEGERFTLDPQLSTMQIDVEKLRNERRNNTTFVNAQRTIQPAIIHDTLPVREVPFVLERHYAPHPFIPQPNSMQEGCQEVFNIQIMGLVTRMKHINSQCAIIGVSGGLDSTLALLVCAKAFDKMGISRKGIIGVTMPGFGTTDRTYNNAIDLMKGLGVTIREINISASVMQHFKDIDHDPSVHDATYENSQARERTQILMDLSNQLGGLVVGTGDLSELALGWATYNGDHMSMYGVNAGVPKTLIRYILKYISEHEVDEKSAATLLDIIDTPISPELIPADEQGNIKQKTEDLVGPYEIHDFYIYHFLRHGFAPEKLLMLAKNAFDGTAEDAGKYDEETLRHWLKVFLRRFFSQQFKRSCLPDGPKVGSVSLSPRGDWRMPSDASVASWLID